MKERWENVRMFGEIVPTENPYLGT